MSNSVWEEVERLQKLMSVARTLDGMIEKHDVLEEDTASLTQEKDPNLTVDDMGEKAEIWRKLESELLPSIKEQSTALLTSLNLQDLVKHPIPDPESTRETLSNLDQTIENTVSVTVLFSLRSPLPDAKHDHRMKKFKAFRLSQLRQELRALISARIRFVLESTREMLHLYTVSDMVTATSATWQKASQLRQHIQMCIADVSKSVHNTIEWYQKSDWATIQDEWLMGVTSCNDLLEEIPDIINRANRRAITNGGSDSTPNLAHFTINSAEEANLTVDNPDTPNRRDSSRELMLDVTRSTISFVKLTRICIKKALEMIPKKPVSELDTELNSEAIVRLQDAFGSFTGSLTMHLRHQQLAHRRDEPISIATRDHICTSVIELREDLRSCLSDLESYLVPFQRGVDDASQINDFSSWSLTMKRLWEQATARSLDLLSSLEIEPEQQLEQED
ncbi:hypothetical protein Pst134EA_027710 [Puccinia striiformis f. sp. tritici]|uniref:Uncharacterized protein n=1 Tax=Puccinia striiformis f. sp. tritici PST-78 TaxID=1165861 RepID=A0A0L0UYM2_9BASI|nr:hypothetical protein Pst134EA_027710 [Puccinia striiformis f. sp. tritici]KAH9448398.1 hypothetical protein Pst134EA_027710 [Puccinia striiformis f. sp. tritici]KAI9625228.1 hypothetical protein H4Q26_016419 [Puccinia striiformis f. sp. tritici PST-130]KNE92120.1 hypothetical protein PSTG_14500 [Puccinia striiformis f. sp. tritici PST-78]